MYIYINAAIVGGLLLIVVEWAMDCKTSESVKTMLKLHLTHTPRLRMEYKKKGHMSFTCSSNQVHNSADNCASFAAGVAFPTRAHGIRYCNKEKSRVRQSVEYPIFALKLTSTLPFNSAP